MAQAPTVALPKRLPLAVDPANRDDTTAKDERLVNCYLEKHGEDYWIIKRPGLLALNRPPVGNGTGQGCYNWLGDVYSIFSGVFYKNGASVGNVDSTNGVYRFSSCLGATPKLIFGNGVVAYTYDVGAGLLTITAGGVTHTAGSFIIGGTYTILTLGTTTAAQWQAAGAGNVDPAFPVVGSAFIALTNGGGGTGTAQYSNFPASFVKGWAFLDGTTYVGLPTAHIQGDQINTPAVWPPSNDIMAQIEPDRLVAMAKQLVYAIALKEWSTEVFFDAGNPAGSPLGSAPGEKKPYGCISSDSVQDVEGTLVWLSTTRSVSVTVVAMTALHIEVISTPAIERLLQNADYTTVWSWQMRIGGHRFYVVTIKNSNLSLVYDLDEKKWWQMTDYLGNYFPIVAATYTNSLKHVLQHESNGWLYQADANFTTDDTKAFTWELYTPNFDGGVRRGKQLARLELIGDQTPGCIVQVRTNDADYAADKWTNFRELDMGQERPFMTDCGTFVRRVHHFRSVSPTRSRIKAVELQMDLCTL